MNPHYATVFFRALFVLAAAGGALAAGYASFPLTYPFLIALILSSAIIPVVDWLDKLTGLPGQSILSLSWSSFCLFFLARRHFSLRKSFREPPIWPKRSLPISAPL